jgi:hypothetical protein
VRAVKTLNLIADWDEFEDVSIALLILSMCTSLGEVGSCVDVATALACTEVSLDWLIDSKSDENVRTTKSL